MVDEELAVSEDPQWRALSQLDWYFGAADAAIGVQAISYQGTGVHVPFDDAASHRLHLRLREPRYRDTMRRRGRIERALAAVDSMTRAILVACFTPTPCEWALRDLFRVEKSNVASLLPLAIRLRVTADALIASNQTETPTPSRLHQFLWEQLSRGHRAAVERLREPARELLFEALAGYAAADKALGENNRAERVARVARWQGASASAT